MLPRPCLDCGRTTQHGSRCPACLAAHTRAREATRPSAAARGYGHAWRTTARQVIAAQPWCSRCGHPGSSDNPLTVDHVTPKAAGGTDDRDNLQVLCRTHNSAKRDR